jgi:anti-anti-sigma factor
MTQGLHSFEYEVEKATDDSTGVVTTTIHCHGRLVAENSGQLKELVKPLIPQGGKIVLDMKELTYLDSSGLGTLASLKASAVKEGYCRLVLENLTPRVKELLSLTRLMEVFAS